MPNFGGFSSNGHGNLGNNGRNGRSGGSGGGRFGGSSDEPEEEDHEHEYRQIAETDSLSAYDETVHSVITLEFHDRGLAIDLSYEEAEELGTTVAAIVEYVRRKQVGEI